MASRDRYVDDDESEDEEDEFEDEDDDFEHEQDEEGEDEEDEDDEDDEEDGAEEEDEYEEEEDGDDEDDEDDEGEFDDEEDEDEDDAEPESGYVEGLVFVGLALREETRMVSRTIKQVCKAEKLDAQQVDERLGSGEILKEIWELIEKAQYLIFDLTFERPNVYYEIGYAHGHGNLDNILLIARAGTVVHFDIGSRRVHYYADEASLRKIIRHNLRVMRGV